MAAGFTTLQLGTYNWATDSFALVLDLNDRVTFFLDTFEIPQPEKLEARAGNIRTQGESITRLQYKNRKITATLSIGPTATDAGLDSAVQALIQAIETPVPGTAAAPAYVLKIGKPNRTTYVYADVLKCVHEPPYNAKEFTARAIGGKKRVNIVWECRPGLRGPRQWLANAVTNPGFEAPSGPGVQVFNDPLTTLNAYSVQAGGALAQSFTGYPDAVMADSPVRYYRLNELSGTTAVDGTSNANNGTYTGSPTLGATGLLTGDSDPAVTFNGTTQYVTLPAAGIPTGNAAWTLECWFKIAANPSGNAVLMNIGANSANGNATLYLDNTGKAHVAVNQTVTVLSSAAGVALNTPHHLVGTWDGTTLRGWLDNVSLGTATPAALAITGNNQYLAAYAGAVSLFPGTLDECAIYSAALSSTRVGAHYTAGTTAPTPLANTLRVPTAGRVAFGSPAWEHVNTWQVRFQWLPECDPLFFLHYTDANNYLAVAVLQGTLALNHAVTGTLHTLVSTSFSAPSLAATSWYWLKVTQFVAITGVTTSPPYVQATLYNDSGGAVGTQVATFAATHTYTATSALSGRPQLMAQSAPLVVGGNFASVHTLSLFGPGGWAFVPSQNGVTGVASGAWDTLWGSTTNPSPTTYPNGPAVSNGAARLDLPPAGTVDSLWHLYAGGTPAGSYAIPVQTAGNTLGYSVAVRGHGLHASNASVMVVITEYNSSGVFTGSASGNLSTTLGAALNDVWVTLAGSYTTHANCAYVDLALRVVDTAVAGESANGVVWWDNAQCWDTTRTGMASMPYCELACAQAPAQLLTSGLLGTLKAPALVAIGTYLSAFAVNQTLTLRLGRIAQSAARLQLIAPSLNITPVLDSTAYAGVTYASNPGPVANRAADDVGTFHLYTRAQTANASPGVVWLQPDVQYGQSGGSFGLLIPGSGALGRYNGPQVYPFSAQNTWTVCDVGQVIIPVSGASVLTDLTQLTNEVSSFSGGTGVGGALTSNWFAMLPVDGEMHTVVTTNLNYATSPAWQYVYVDGVQQVTTWSRETAALPNPTHSAASYVPGTAASTGMTAVPGTDAQPLVDPTQRANTLGVNQYCLLSYDNTTLIPPAAVEVIYWPLYLFPL